MIVVSRLMESEKKIEKQHSTEKAIEVRLSIKVKWDVEYANGLIKYRRH